MYLFTGLDHWTGLLDWTTGFTFDPKNGINQCSIELSSCVVLRV